MVSSYRADEKKTSLLLKCEGAEKLGCFAGQRFDHLLTFSPRIKVAVIDAMLESGAG
jgi:hypothetical protein